MERIEADVRARYRKGRQALKLTDEKSDSVGEALETLGAEASTNPATLLRARQFARVYTETQLEALLKLRTPEGLPLGWSHVQELISIKSRAERGRTQRRAAREGWTVRRLKAEVQRVESGKRSKGGRKFALPEAPEERLGRLAELGQTWLRLLEDVVPAEHAGLSDRIAEGRSAGRRDAIRASPRKVLEALTRVQARAGEAGETLRASSTWINRQPEPTGTGRGGRGDAARAGGDGRHRPPRRSAACPETRTRRGRTSEEGVRRGADRLPGRPGWPWRTR